jgi:hypothetical protein
MFANLNAFRYCTSIVFMRRCLPSPTRPIRPSTHPPTYTLHPTTYTLRETRTLKPYAFNLYLSNASLNRNRLQWLRRARR